MIISADCMTNNDNDERAVQTRTRKFLGIYNFTAASKSSLALAAGSTVLRMCVCAMRCDDVDGVSTENNNLQFWMLRFSHLRPKFGVKSIFPIVFRAYIASKRRWWSTGDVMDLRFFFFFAEISRCQTVIMCSNGRVEEDVFINVINISFFSGTTVTSALRSESGVRGTPNAFPFGNQSKEDHTNLSHNAIIRIVRGDDVWSAHWHFPMGQIMRFGEACGSDCTRTCKYKLVERHVEWIPMKLTSIGLLLLLLRALDAVRFVVIKSQNGKYSTSYEV